MIYCVNNADLSQLVGGTIDVSSGFLNPTCLRPRSQVKHFTLFCHESYMEWVLLVFLFMKDGTLSLVAVGIRLACMIYPIYPGGPTVVAWPLNLMVSRQPCLCQPWIV